MIRSSVIKVGLSIAASVTVVASGAVIGSDAADNPTSPSWEAGQVPDADAVAARDIAAMKAERVARAEATASRMAADRRKAAARKRAEAKRRAEARAAARARLGGTPRQNRALGMTMCADHGWSASQCADLGRLWDRESGWDSHAHNVTSGAYGIPQALPGSKMSSRGQDWATNARTQIAWGLDYIAEVYGSPSNAWGHSQRVGWY